MSEATTVGFNPFEPGFQEDPYPQYARLRSRDPVHKSPMGGWVLTRYVDIWALLRDQRTSSADIIDEQTREALLRSLGLWDAWTDSVVRELVNATMLTMDPPEHTRVRGLVNKAFTPKAVEGLRPRIQELVDGLLDRVRGEESFDVVEFLAKPLPALVICELLGVPAADRQWLQELSHAGTVLVEPMLDADQLRAGDSALRQLLDYFGELVAERRRQPQPDVLTAMTAAEIEGEERLADRELAINAILLFAAGHETTTNLIGTGTLALLEHPGELRTLRADPSLVPSAVEEMLRYESPVQLTGRRAVEEISVDGETLPAGDRIVLLVGAGNRDPERFGDPDRFDLSRAEVRPLTFGGGIHFCLGAALARAEAQIAFTALLRSFPDMGLDAPPTRRQSLTLRGLDSLRIRVS